MATPTQPVDDRRPGPRLSVVIVNWNGGADLARCLESVRGS